jgi:hypothetical protein
MHCCAIKSVEDMDNFEPAHERPMLKGIIKCLLVPPHGAPVGDQPNYYPPVIPLRLKNRLLFSFCKSCSKSFDEGFKDEEYFCPHFNWKERCWVATVTSEELREALKVGYAVKKIYRTYHFDRWTTGLFADYVRKFLKLKIQASGWPSSCIDEATKEAFVKKCFDDYGVVLDPTKVALNSGLRYIAKVNLHITV